LSNRGQLFIISGPSGAGKGTVVQGLLSRRPSLLLSISASTRPPRPTEKHGVHYLFVSEQEFLRMRERGELLEWANVHGNLYGTPRRFVEDNLTRGRHVLLEIDVQGAREIKRKLPEARLIFIEPPSFGVLEQRLRKRSSEREDEVARRMAAAYDEMRSKRWFDGVIVNEVVDQTVNEVLQLIDKLIERPPSD
jgi:guanylate kinase